MPPSRPKPRWYCSENIVFILTHTATSRCMPPSKALGPEVHWACCLLPPFPFSARATASLQLLASCQLCTSSCTPFSAMGCIGAFIHSWL